MRLKSLVYILLKLDIMLLRRGKGGDMYHLECYQEKFKKEHEIDNTNNHSALTAPISCNYCKKEIKVGEEYTWTRIILEPLSFDR